MYRLNPIPVVSCFLRPSADSIFLAPGHIPVVAYTPLKTVYVAVLSVFPILVSPFLVAGILDSFFPFSIWLLCGFSLNFSVTLL